MKGAMLSGVRKNNNSNGINNKNIYANWGGEYINSLPTGHEDARKHVQCTTV